MIPYINNHFRAMLMHLQAMSNINSAVFMQKSHSFLTSFFNTFYLSVFEFQRQYLNKLALFSP